MASQPKQKQWIAASVIVVSLIVAVLILHGCGGGDPPHKPDNPDFVPVDCPEVMKRGHCTQCMGNKVKTFCKACSGNYSLDENATSPDLLCRFQCTAFVQQRPPSKPTNAQQHNGIEWPAICIEESVTRFFMIGDWGGVCGWNDNNKCLPDRKPDMCICGHDCGDKGKPCPMPNRAAATANAIDGVAQRLVSERMLARQKKLKEEGNPARFIVNVGDNFYPGGIDMHCGQEDHSATSSQFQQIWKAMYREDLQDLEWWSVLGNHDYGGVCYIKGWDQQIFFTWNDDKWVMPGQYWRRTVQLANFKADFFFIDGNIHDTGMDEDHDLCSKTHNPGSHCENEFYPGDGANCAATGPHTQPECQEWFKKLWADNFQWLKAGLAASDADWQFVVNHYPATYNLGDGPSRVVWAKFLEPMGVDLYISGHTHEQTVYYGPKPDLPDFGKTAWVITGGGGGITTDQPARPDGDDDQYGFMEVALSLEWLNITAYSHGGLNNRTVIRSQHSVAPVPRASHERLLELGILTEEYMQLSHATSMPSIMAVV